MTPQFGFHRPMVQINLLCVARHSAFRDLAAIFVSIRILLSIVPIADARAESFSH
jgi:hypothetical protein